MRDRVELVGPEPSGLAEMLAAIARDNLQRDPSRARFLSGTPGVVAITASDAGVTVALEFRDGKVRVYSGERTAPPDVHIVADSAFLAAPVPRLGPLPHPLRPEGRAAWRRILRGEVRVRGALRGRKLLRRMRGLLEVDAG